MSSFGGPGRDLSKDCFSKAGVCCGHRSEHGACHEDFQRRHSFFEEGPIEVTARKRERENNLVEVCVGVPVYSPTVASEPSTRHQQRRPTAKLHKRRVHMEVYNPNNGESHVK